MRTNLIVTRGNLGQFGSFIGGLGLLVGLLGLIWQGGTFTPYIAAFFGLGILGMILWAYMTPQEFQSFITGRQARQSTLAIFSTFFLVGVVALLYIYVQREAIVADVTLDARFTLTDETLEVLQVASRTPQRIEITAFYYPNQIVNREIDDSYFQLYESATSGHIFRHYVNPVEEPAFTDRYLDLIQGGTYIFLSFVDPAGNILPETTIPVQSSNRQEFDITQAILQLMAAGQYKVYFETSLEEPDPLAQTQQGMSTFNSYLRTNGYITEPLNLASIAEERGNIPQDASAVILARPRRDLTDAEIRVLDAYLKGGGCLFIAADIFFTDDQFLGTNSAFNQYLWDNYGVRAMMRVVVDPQASGQTELDVISAAVFEDNSISMSINQENDTETRTQFRVARPIELNTAPPVPNGSVIMTSPAAWAESDLVALASSNSFSFDPDTDQRGPLTTVAWARNDQNNSKIVLVGDGDFLTNGQLEAPRGNIILGLNALGWMTGYTEELRFEPRGFAIQPVLGISGQELDVIAFITVIFMPGAMLVLALAVYVRRLRQ